MCLALTSTSSRTCYLINHFICIAIKKILLCVPTSAIATKVGGFGWPWLLTLIVPNIGWVCTATKHSSCFLNCYKHINKFSPNIFGYLWSPCYLQEKEIVWYWQMLFYSIRRISEVPKTLRSSHLQQNT